MSRRARAREVSSSPEPRNYIDISDDSDELGTADLTLSILAKAERRKAEKRERNRASDGAARDVVVLESEEDSGSADEVGGGAAAPPAQVEPREEEELEEGELNDAAEPAPELEPETPAVTIVERKKKKKKEKRKKEASARVANMGETKPEEDELAETKLQDSEHSLAMRKLLRGPRYFDPPDEQGEMCYSCGQIGHRAVDCTEQPRQKPCYVCGNFGHDGYDCPEKTECFECGKSGHVARVCPNRYSKPRSSTGICLLCGRLGHDASTCSGEYDPDDLKQVHCYICKRSGHLCCIEVTDASPTPVSCYQCGDLGHTGLGCNRQGGDRGDKTLCFKCGQEGHFARDCHQMNRDYNNKQRRYSWPAPWPVDNGRHGDRESPVTPACHIRPPSFKSRLEQASSDKYKEFDDSRRGSKRKRYEDEDDRWTPRSTDSRHRRSRD
ncbi:hypothetical protein M758_10G172000 [Ceratodon purpureus]|nr:hypothetical protein M758_10G172000 [Ceratodon purpureus]